MKRLPRFWKALTEIPGAETDARDWRERLGDEFPLLGSYLRPTGHLARSVDCPSSGGDHCPRRVIANGDGTYRAVCQSPEVGCETLRLAKADIAVLALDVGRLAGELTRLFEVQPIDIKAGRSPAICLGKHEIAAGIGAPVVLVLPDPQERLAEGDLRACGIGSTPAIVLVPSEACLCGEAIALLGSGPNQIVALSDVVASMEGASLQLVQPVEIILAPTRRRLEGINGQEASVRPVRIPPGTTWGQIKLAAKSNSLFTCSTPTGVRDLGPADLGMASRGDKAPHQAWQYLLMLARLGGEIPRPAADVRGKAQKQLQLLSDALRDLLRLEARPIRFDRRRKCYVAAFIICDQRPLNQTRRDRPF